jgi:hypothetical protein
MKNYTNEERLAVLNRHMDALSINGKTAFTILTQHLMNCTSIEEIADTIITTEKFMETYNYTNDDLFGRGTSLYTKRRRIFFNEDRILTEEETDVCVAEDVEYEEIWNNVFNMIKK